MIDVYKILPNTCVEGPKQRFCIWVQGCAKHCPDCWAKETWEFGVGEKYSVNELFELIMSERENIEGITILGGEPFEQAKDLSKLCKKCKAQDLGVLCFSGYTLEELKSKKDKNVDELLKNVDLLIDGAFEKEKYDLSRPWVGSSNQKYHFFTDRYSQEEINSYSNKIELRVKKDGKLEINGMGDFEHIKKEFSLQLGKNIVK